MRILHTESSKYSNESINRISCENELIIREFPTQESFEKFLTKESFDCIFTRIGLEINKDVINTQIRLKYIVSPTTGLNHVDLDTASKKKIKIISLKGEIEFLNLVRSTAEHTWGLLLSLIRNVNVASNDVKNGYWRRDPFVCEELDGKTIGIVGFGRLGKIIARYANAFFMKVLVYDINPSSYLGFNGNIEIKKSVEDLLSNSDIISLHIPYNEDNYNFLDSNKFSFVKNGAYFVNTSRGEVVDEDILINYLDKGIIKGAALDVLHNDSSWNEKSQKNKLIDYSRNNHNLIITPHIGGYGKSSIEKTRNFITKKFLKTNTKNN